MPNDLQNLYDIDAGDEVPSNHSPNPTFRDIAEARLGRRGMLMGGLGAALTGFIGAGSRPVLPATARRPASAGVRMLIGDLRTESTESRRKAAP